MASNVYIAYTDSTHTAIGTWYASPQNSLPGGAPANYAATVSTDPLWATFYGAQPVGSQQYMPAPGQ